MLKKRLHVLLIPSKDEDKLASLVLHLSQELVQDLNTKREANGEFDSFIE